MKCFIHKFYDIISYKRYYKKNLKELEQKKNDYLKMDNDVFLYHYIEIHSIYEKKKMIFTVVFVGLIISIITDSWKYCFNFLNNILLSDDDIVINFVNEAKWFIIFMTLVIVGIAFFILFIMIRRLYQLNKEKILIYEIKKIRSDAF